MSATTLEAEVSRRKALEPGHMISITPGSRIEPIGQSHSGIMQAMERIRKRCAAMAAKWRPYFDELPESRACGSHPDFYRAKDWEGTYEQSCHDEEFKPMYEPCPKCGSDAEQARKRRFWARRGMPERLAEGVTTTYHYDNGARDLTGITYSDGTPAVNLTFNRLGNLLAVSNGVAGSAFGYDKNLCLAQETLTGVASRTLSRAYDSFGRTVGVALLKGTAVIEQQTGYGYDAAGRINVVTSGSGASAQVFTYQYVPNSLGVIASVSGPVLTTTNTYGSDRGVLLSKENLAGGGVVSQYAYAVNNIGQRTSVQESGKAFTGNAFNFYGYDGVGQLTSANRYTGGTLAAPQNPVGGQQFVLTYDGIGNRLTTTDGNSAGTYTPNALNQYSAVPDGTGAPVSATYDDDGNLTRDGVLTYSWDAENRLVSVTKADNTQITCAYDAFSRRVRKRVTNGIAVESDTGYLYDGWNLGMEYDLMAAGGPAVTAANTCGALIWTVASKVLGALERFSRVRQVEQPILIHTMEMGTSVN